ncbi:MAG: hypothetical protein RLZZ176_3200 [Cyanobacteriota bacterium]
MIQIGGNSVNFRKKHMSINDLEFLQGAAFLRLLKNVDSILKVIN